MLVRARHRGQQAQVCCRDKLAPPRGRPCRAGFHSVPPIDLSCARGQWQQRLEPSPYLVYLSLRLSATWAVSKHADGCTMPRVGSFGRSERTSWLGRPWLHSWRLSRLVVRLVLDPSVGAPCWLFQSEITPIVRAVQVHASPLHGSTLGWANCTRGEGLFFLFFTPGLVAADNPDDLENHHDRFGAFIPFRHYSLRTQVCRG